MKNTFAAVFLLGGMMIGAPITAASGTVAHIEVEGTIGLAAPDYIAGSMLVADEWRATCLLVRFPAPATAARFSLPVDLFGPFVARTLGAPEKDAPAR